MKQIVTNSPNETFALGKKIGNFIKPGMVICLSGEMGAGKTALTQGIVKGVGIEDYVTSPTYTIVNEYQGSIPIYHFDVFRIEDVEELYEIGFEEYLDGQGVVILEWASYIEEILPQEYLWISIEKGENFTDRIFTLNAKGKLYEDLIKEL
ncbi:tRNA (adenosine(37)-N6)-threonylcarbamoyltransferase complex ATPase subunit type 1 TsaE [Garciella nitratireducens]|uniref:tRNA threonylcarbamoyladenosine biosynthesis protein TsaE n=1 Tax=Garciella nitratireducens DSM 15102 TaxID=1121911 RepID=A0A1T4LZ27_9FIRM|nr:tRNA (adenosine(37)-N6)-threonylcarbamoyltransferase complex ATPase subunit type 1 TsaE [Garciella nitratireducens]RBP44121.1 tRNA threonylcarbamoyladenosine biosynthesis protein TsaE [Garciella nitratireducens]SJZ59915.1 tRNA threonylcarbamoyladenosine biosynthesis protein TsaE [Garciella nitratireducens DSM 15102]